MEGSVARRASPLVALYGFMLSIGLAACAATVEYTAKPVPVPIVGAMPGWVTESGVAVGADPYVQPERQQAFFGLKLGRMDVLPVQVLIRNDRDRAILVRPYEIALLLPDGRAVTPVGAAEAVARGMGAPVQFSSTGRLAAGSAPVVGAYAGPSASGAVYSVVAVEGFFLVAKLKGRRELHRQLFADYRAKELGEVTLNKNESRYGFVYFILPPDTAFPSDLKLAVRVIDTENAIASVVEVPLTHLDLRGIP